MPLFSNTSLFNNFCMLTTADFLSLSVFALLTWNNSLPLFSIQCFLLFLGNMSDNFSLLRHALANFKQSFSLLSSRESHWRMCSISQYLPLNLIVKGFFGNISENFSWLSYFCANLKLKSLPPVMQTSIFKIFRDLSWLFVTNAPDGRTSIVTLSQKEGDVQFRSILSLWKWVNSNGAHN